MLGVRPKLSKDLERTMDLNGKGNGNNRNNLSKRFFAGRFFGNFYSGRVAKRKVLILASELNFRFEMSKENQIKSCK
jgi:hypothetical protein